MDAEAAREIILNAVRVTEKRWRTFDVHWNEIDEVFIRNGFEQGGFHFHKLFELLKQKNIGSINVLGSILDNFKGNTKYNREFAGSLRSNFYKELYNKKFGDNGFLFYECVLKYQKNNLGKPGYKMFSLLWYLLRCCNYLKANYDASFSKYIKIKYCAFAKLKNISDEQFLKISQEDWKDFLEKAKPWKELIGIGENTFDFIYGDIVEANFASGSFDFDSAIQKFFRVTGISKLITPFDKENSVNFLKKINLPYKIREINKGIYTYCSDTEKDEFGFCRYIKDCYKCNVFKICEKKL